MTTRIIAVDVEAIVIDWLIASAAVRNTFGDLDDTRISAALDHDELAVSARISAGTGLTAVPRHLTAPNVEIEVWGPTKAAAFDGANLLHARLHASGIIGIHAGRGVVTEVEDSQGLKWFPDADADNHPRYIFGVRVYCHPLPA